ncbi:MAG: hypothetical protein Q7U38_14465 [Methylobacter sp.]|nr:hypothetical protein [Methylobacter sp.]
MAVAVAVAVVKAVKAVKAVKVVKVVKVVAYHVMGQAEQRFPVAHL